MAETTPQRPGPGDDQLGLRRQHWLLLEDGLDLDRLAQTESLFALANGHIGMRGNLDEGEPHALPGTYLNSFYETRPLPYAEAGYGYPEAGQTVVNVINGKPIRLLVDDEPFDLRYGRPAPRAASRPARRGPAATGAWELAGPATVKVRSTRHGVAGAAGHGRHRVRGRGARRPGPGRRSVGAGRQRGGAAPVQRPPGGRRACRAPCGSCQRAADDELYLMAETERSGLRMAAMMEPPRCEGPERHRVAASRATTTSAGPRGSPPSQPGQMLRIVKLVAYGWSGRALRARRCATRCRQPSRPPAHRVGGHAAEQRAFLDGFWSRPTSGSKATTELQHAIRFALFHVLQSGVRSRGAGHPRPRA